MCSSLDCCCFEDIELNKVFYVFDVFFWFFDV